ncbi:hypothetical protein AB4Z34_35090 [Ensifer sp. 2YAB10]|uniref:hypothetical protein n=1 Tax=unclassified Ensifer TaxID=2633371 RepID=UPI0013B042C5|nr:hypothetical protein [Ensifer sp. SSB1]MBK5568663.1 hypothetical protein [Ensifer sp. SSB1]
MIWTIQPAVVMMGKHKEALMISRIVAFLRPVSVAATIVMAAIAILCFWGFQIVSWETLWKLFFSYLALMIASSLICYIDDPKRLTGRG